MIIIIAGSIIAIHHLMQTLLAEAQKVDSELSRLRDARDRWHNKACTLERDARTVLGQIVTAIDSDDVAAARELALDTLELLGASAVVPSTPPLPDGENHNAKRAREDNVRDDERPKRARNDEPAEAAVDESSQDEERKRGRGKPRKTLAGFTYLRMGAGRHSKYTCDQCGAVCDARNTATHVCNNNTNK